MQELLKISVSLPINSEIKITRYTIRKETARTLIIDTPTGRQGIKRKRKDNLGVPTTLAGSKDKLFYHIWCRPEDRKVAIETLHRHIKNKLISIEDTVRTIRSTYEKVDWTDL